MTVAKANAIVQQFKKKWQSKNVIKQMTGAKRNITHLLNKSQSENVISLSDKRQMLKQLTQ